MTESSPIYQSLQKQIERSNLRLHMPGHAGIKGILTPELEELTYLDYTEIPGLDNLHVPKEAIAEAQQLMARACGAEQSFFLVNGATSGIQALLMSSTEHEKVIIPRNAHLSFYGGLVLSGGIPIYARCQVEPGLGIAIATKSETIDKLVSEHKDAEVVWITSPTYYGTCSDIGAIHSSLSNQGKLLMVDEAHGGHFPFHPLFPTPAIKQGAAAVVNGLHKTWPVLTQGACLHLGVNFHLNSFGNTPCLIRMSARGLRLMAAYHLLTTTSPSYPIMASIDLARDFMEQRGYYFLEQNRVWSSQYKERLNRIEGIKCLSDELIGRFGIKAIDPLKVMIDITELSLTGYQLGAILRNEFKIQVEIEQPGMILAMFSILHSRDDWEYFYYAIKTIALRYPANRGKEPEICLPPDWLVVLTPREAFYAAKRKVKVADCRGLIAGEMVAPYPPGIPCILPGEKITDEIWEYLLYLQASEVSIQGPEDIKLEYILVIDK